MTIKKLIALILCLAAVMSFAALAEADYTWKVPAEDVGRGSYVTLNLTPNTKARVFIYDDWQPADRELYDANTSVMWIAEDGSKLKVEVNSLENSGVSTLEDIDALYAQANCWHQIRSINGMDVCLFCSDDPLYQRGSCFVTSEFIFQFKVCELKDESQIALADKMLSSIYRIDVIPGDIGYKPEELDAENGKRFNITIGKDALSMYLTNDYQLLSQEDSWEELRIVARGVKENGDYIYFYAYDHSYLNVDNLYDFMLLMKDSGFNDSRLVTINGMQAAYFANAEGTEHGIALALDGYVLMVKAGQIHEMDQLTAARQILFSAYPAQ